LQVKPGIKLGQVDTYSFGATLPVRKRFELEGYYERENTTGSAPPHVNGIGTTLSIYFHPQKV